MSWFSPRVNSITLIGTALQCHTFNTQILKQFCTNVQAFNHGYCSLSPLNLFTVKTLDIKWVYNPVTKMDDAPGIKWELQCSLFVSRTRAQVQTRRGEYKVPPYDGRSRCQVKWACQPCLNPAECELKCKVINLFQCIVTKTEFYIVTLYCNLTNTGCVILLTNTCAKITNYSHL